MGYFPTHVLGFVFLFFKKLTHLFYISEIELSVVVFRVSFYFSKILGDEMLIFNTMFVAV